MTANPGGKPSGQDAFDAAQLHPEYLVQRHPDADGATLRHRVAGELSGLALCAVAGEQRVGVPDVDLAGPRVRLAESDLGGWVAKPAAQLCTGDWVATTWRCIATAHADQWPGDLVIPPAVLRIADRSTLRCLPGTRSPRSVAGSARPRTRPLPSPSLEARRPPSSTGAATSYELSRKGAHLMLKAFFNASASASLTPASADTGASTSSAGVLDS